MAEGLLNGVFGGEAEDEAASSPSEPALAAAMAHARAQDSKEARLYLKDARRMLQLQIETLHEERILNLKHMKARRWRDALQLSFQFLGVAIAGVVGLAIVLMMHDAFTARSVVVEAFGAPPALASRGLSGAAVAEGVLDQLAVLQASTRSSAAKRNLSSAWTGDIKVDVPETGISVGELDRMLKKRFGHDLHIGGDLVQAADGGLELTVRGDGVLPKTFAGGPADLGKLQTAAAEYVFGQTEPALYVTYLTNAGRDPEAVAFAQQNYATAAESERPYMLNGWAVAVQNTGGAPAEVQRLLRAAVQLKPDYWVAYNNLMNLQWLVADEEGVLRTSEAMKARAGGRPGRAPEFYYVNADMVAHDLSSAQSALTEDLKRHGGIGTGVASSRIMLADMDQQLHDPASAELEMQTARTDPHDPTVGALASYVRGGLAMDAGDWKRAAAELDAFAAANADPRVSSNFPGYVCRAALADEFAGTPAKADAILRAAGAFLDCRRFRGDILDHRGDWKGAQAAYADAVAHAPDLPGGYYSWGLALARHGDAAGALAKLAAASLHGPHWADPLKAWGDVLASQGRWWEAAAKYDQALTYAPKWTAAAQARDAARRR